VTERGLQVGLTRIRAGADSRPSPVTETDVRRALATVMDPELPMVSVVDLGMVGAVEVGDGIRVDLLPTFIGCPAIDLIRSAVADRLRWFGRPVEVRASYAPPWSSDRITPAGLASLAAAGIAPPTAGADVRCPYCASDRVVLDNAFGATQCRSLFYCRHCRQPFEAIKRV
jgi:ring-1,2-phenylacetyl-CoA epoxidase subunit PaaD